MFLHGAEWLVDNQVMILFPVCNTTSGYDQDPVTGGWPTPVTFNKEQKKYPGAKEIRPGWYGAMCQVCGLVL